MTAWNDFIRWTFQNPNNGIPPKLLNLCCVEHDQTVAQLDEARKVIEWLLTWVDTALPELDDARKVIEAANMGDWFTPTSDWLASHPKDGEK